MRPKALRLDIFLKSALIHNIIKILSANIVSRILNFSLSIFVIKKLSVSDFGTFTFGIFTSQIIPQVLDFGLNETVVRFGAKVKEDRKTLVVVLSYVLKVRLITALLIIVLGFYAGFFLLPHIFKGKNLTNAFLLGIIGSIGIFLWNFVQSFYRIEEDFTKLSFFNIVYSVLLVILVLFLFYSGFNRYTWILTAYISIPFICAIFFGRPLLKIINISLSVPEKLKKELFHYSFWLTISTISFIGLRRLDILFLTYFCSLETVGIYGAALRLIAPFQMLSQATSQVLLPRVSQYNTKFQFRKFVNYSYLFTILFLGIIATICMFMAPLIFSFFQKTYLNSVSVFQLLVYLPVVGTLANLMSYLFLSIGRPEIPSKINFIQAIFNIILSLLLIPYYGAIGAAIAILTTATIGTICQVYFAERYLSYA